MPRRSGGRGTNECVVTFRAAPEFSTPQPLFTETLWGKDELEPSDTTLQEQPLEHEQRLIKAVQHVNEYGFITNATYRALTGISDRTAHRDLETLVERGRLKGIG